MKYFQDKYEHVIFILITIDYDWFQQNGPKIQNAGNVVVNPYHNENYDVTYEKIHDLVLLSNCNHSIINYGTFGVTAALFARGNTFVYNLQLPLDHRGSTLGVAVGNILHDWYVEPW